MLYIAALASAPLGELLIIQFFRPTVNGRMLFSAILLDEQLEKQIAALEAKIKAEKQPKKKFELVQKLRRLQAQCNINEER